MRLRKILDLLNERIEDPTLREHFERETKALSLEMLRTTALIGMFLFPLFGTLDVIDFPDALPQIVAAAPGRSRRLRPDLLLPEDAAASGSTRPTSAWS